MSFRAELVELMKLDAGITAVVSDKIVDIIDDFEDFLNEAPNKADFPRILIRQNQVTKEENLSGSDAKFEGSYEIEISNVIMTNDMRSRSLSRRESYNSKVREIDDLTDLVEEFCRDLRNTLVGDYFLSKAHTRNSTENAESLNDNQTIITKSFTLEVSFNKE